MLSNGMAQFSTIRKGRPTTTHVLLLAAIAVQLVASYFFNIRTSFYTADDIIAIDLAYKTSFWDYVLHPIDVHRVPLHRAANHLIHHLLPMNFKAATLFLLSCHALSMLVLYHLLKKLNDSPLNIWLVTAYALNAFMQIPLHWWSAGLHRFPYVLATITSCYCFVRFHQSNRFRDGIMALLCALIAVGFYIKGLLVPLYWAAIMFCTMELKDWRKPVRQYAVLTAGGLLSLAYVAGYLSANTHNVTDPRTASDTVRIGMQWGISIVAQMPLQMYFRSEYAFCINLAWVILLVFFAARVRDAWRPILAAMILIAANLMMINLSSRSLHVGPFIMLAPRYYYEALFLVVIFASLMCRNFTRPNFPLPLSQNSDKSIVQCMKPVWLTIALTLYAAASWRTTLLYTNPGPTENHWRSAQYERNLLTDIQTIGVDNLSLTEGALPAYFLYDRFVLKPLPLSTYLSWHGLHPQFGKTDKPLYSVDENGNLQPAK